MGKQAARKAGPPPQSTALSQPRCWKEGCVCSLDTPPWAGIQKQTHLLIFFLLIVPTDSPERLAALLQTFKEHMHAGMPMLQNLMGFAGLNMTSFSTVDNVKYPFQP